MPKQEDIFEKFLRKAMRYQQAVSSHDHTEVKLLASWFNRNIEEVTDYVSDRLNQNKEKLASIRSQWETDHPDGEPTKAELESVMEDYGLDPSCAGYPEFYTPAVQSAVDALYGPSWEETTPIEADSYEVQRSFGECGAAIKGILSPEVLNAVSSRRIWSYVERYAEEHPDVSVTLDLNKSSYDYKDHSDNGQPLYFDKNGRQRAVDPAGFAVDNDWAFDENDVDKIANDSDFEL